MNPASSQPASAGAHSTTNSTSDTSYGFVIDNRRCIGCHACTVACKSEHEDPISVNKTWVSYIEKGIYPETTRQFHVMRCNHCADAPCVEICPTACLTTRDDGIVDFDSSRCIGCKACMQACPYDAITINPDSGTATKCNYCAHRVEEGREPACVVVCPAEAIVPGDLNDPKSKIAAIVASQDVTVRKPEKGTLPKLYYVEGDAAALQPAASIRTRETLWGEKAPDIVDETPAALGQIQSAEAGAPRRAYDIAQRHAGSWGWKVSAYLFTKSIAAGAFLVPALAVLAGSGLGGLMLPGVLLALLGLAVTGVLLVADLKRPERFLWVLLRPQWKSWLVRGAYIIGAYSVVLLLMLGLQFGWPPKGSATTLLILGSLLAAGTASYSGWLFGQAKGRDLWQSPLVPLHLLVQALVVGTAIFLPFADEAWLPIAFLALLVVDLVFVAQDVWGRHQTADASRAAKLMRTGSWGMLLVVGALGAGRVLPFLLVAFADGVTPLRVLAGLLACAGVAIYEHLWVAAPQRVALS